MIRWISKVWELQSARLVNCFKFGLLIAIAGFAGSAKSEEPGLQTDTLAFAISGTSSVGLRIVPPVAADQTAGDTISLGASYGTSPITAFVTLDRAAASSDPALRGVGLTLRDHRGLDYRGEVLIRDGSGRTGTERSGRTKIRVSARFRF